MEYNLLIKEFRLLKNMTQVELADKIDVRQAYISKLENNLTNPTLNIIFEIAAALDVCPHALISYNYECHKNCIANCNLFFNA